MVVWNKLSQDVKTSPRSKVSGSFSLYFGGFHSRWSQVWAKMYKIVTECYYIFISLKRILCSMLRTCAPNKMAWLPWSLDKWRRQVRNPSISNTYNFSVKFKKSLLTRILVKYRTVNSERDNLSFEVPFLFFAYFYRLTAVNVETVVHHVNLWSKMPLSPPPAPTSPSSQHYHTRSCWHQASTCTQNGTLRSCYQLVSGSLYMNNPQKTPANTGNSHYGITLFY